MIKFRQKQFSLPMTRGLVRVNRMLGKSPMQSKRAAIKQQNKIITPVAKGLGKIKSTKAGLESAAINPGGAINRGTESLLRHPITVTSQVAGKVTMVTNPTSIGLIPIGAIGTGGEMALRKYVPRYARATDKLGNAYHGSRLSKNVEAGSNAIIGSLKNMMI